VASGLSRAAGDAASCRLDDVGRRSRQQLGQTAVGMALQHAVAGAAAVNAQLAQGVLRCAGGQPRRLLLDKAALVRLRRRDRSLVDLPVEHNHAEHREPERAAGRVDDVPGVGGQRADRPRRQPQLGFPAARDVTLGINQDVGVEFVRRFGVVHHSVADVVVGARPRAVRYRRLFKVVPDQHRRHPGPSRWPHPDHNHNVNTSTPDPDLDPFKVVPAADQRRKAICTKQLTPIFHHKRPAP